MGGDLVPLKCEKEQLMPTINHPRAGATVNNPFQTDGTAGPESHVSALLRSRTQAETELRGSPKSMMGPKCAFVFNVPADDYKLIVSEGAKTDEIDITVI